MAFREARLVPACANCKRPGSQPHADWCDGTPVPPPETPGPSPVVIKRTAPTASATDVIEFRQVLQSPADRHTERAKEQRAAAMAKVARRRAAAVADAKPRTPEPAPAQASEPIDPITVASPKEEPMPATIAEALEAKGLTTLPQPEAEKPVKFCKDCGKQPRYVVTKTGRADPRCEVCRNRYAREWYQANKAKQPQASDAQPEAASARKPSGNGDGRVEHRQPKNESLPGDPRASAEMTLPELQAERTRVAAYLADLDERIETAKALEALEGIPVDALRDMHALAVKQARQIEMALQVRAG